MKKMPQIKPSKANRPRNAFDLSQKHMFTAPCGALLPILCLDLNFHDHVEIQASDFMRTLPMNTAAFISMRSVYEFFFVPYSQLWHQFDQFITGMNDFRSSAVASVSSNKVPLLVPHVSRDSLFKSLLESEVNTDIFGFNHRYNSLRLLDLLGYGKLGLPDIYSKFPSEDDFYLQGNVSLFRIAAYNKIYSDYYRNTSYEPYEVDSFSLDKYNGLIPLSVTSDVLKMFNLRYRNAPLDYFTNLLPKPLFDIDINSINAGLSLSDGSNGDTFGVGSSRISAYFANADNDIINVSSIRSAFALDKLLSITARAGKTYAEQISAHFGVEVSEGRDGQVYYLGGFDSDVQVGDVTQTSGTTDPAVSDVSKSKLAGYLGKVTGKGVGSGSGRIVFDAKEPGLLMCIYSLVPAMQYDSTRVDPLLTKLERGDFFIPEFENLGMQPLRSIYVTDDDGTKKGDPAVLFGWQPRYSELKTALDVNHGQFTCNGPLAYWTISRARQFPSKSDFANGNKFAFNISQLKISPRWVNSVFAVNYNGNELSDCMFGYAHFKIQKVSDMSEDGMPRV